MTTAAFRARLARRAKSAGVTLSTDLSDQLETYFRLLVRWNAKVNLTALALDPATDEALDRLLIEPLAAARSVDESWSPWFDVGSGGGSPAVPLKLVKPGMRLIMVEAKARKAAFLREVVRNLGFEGAIVETARFEDLADRPGVRGSAGLVTIRAVRPDARLLSSVAEALRRDGHLLTFGRSPGGKTVDGFGFKSSSVLTPSRERPAYLLIYRRS